MITNTQAYYLHLVAAILLMGIGIYWFIMGEQQTWGLFLVAGGVMNMYMAKNFKDQEANKKKNNNR